MLVLALAPTIGQAELVASIQSIFFFFKCPKEKVQFFGNRGKGTLYSRLVSLFIFYWGKFNDCLFNE